MQSLIEQVNKCAEAQKRVRQDPPRLLTMTWEHGIGIAVQFPEGLDFPALLARMQAQQAVVDAARKAKHYLEHRTTCKYLWDGVECDCGYISVSAALDAALSENPDVE